MCGEHKIDHIVVIGSDETFLRTEKGIEGDDIKKVNLAEYYKSHETYSTNNLTAYAFYRRKIGEFCVAKNQDIPNYNMDAVRADYLKQLADEFMINKGFTDKSEWFHIIAEDERNSNKKGLCEEINKLAIDRDERTIEENGNSHDNIIEILSAIRSNNKDNVNLYVDMQGGSRTDGYVISRN